ncbi:hypothetical protein TREES_T100010684 [Tupaia chinensis]|uniref:Uncharacterized protein n=1 Tax=Tupaia chinensis TaxID=246437 RepID=L9KPS0_TUPCH|nr:hypothetical protein TREES_T100010684 [Tupaia chinensis]
MCGAHALQDGRPRLSTFPQLRLRPALSFPGSRLGLRLAAADGQRLSAKLTPENTKLPSDEGPRGRQILSPLSAPEGEQPWTPQTLPHREDWAEWHTRTSPRCSFTFLHVGQRTCLSVDCLNLVPTLDVSAHPSVSLPECVAVSVTDM